MRLAVLLAASLACVGIGFAKSAALSAHVKDLETLQKIIQYLRGEIVTAASPLPDAFWETGRRMRDPYRDFLQDISEDMRRPDGKTLPCPYPDFFRLPQIHLRRLQRIFQNIRKQFYDFIALHCPNPLPQYMSRDRFYA